VKTTLSILMALIYFMGGVTLTLALQAYEGGWATAETYISFVAVPVCLIGALAAQRARA
jgi:hypothetical protein